MATVKISNRFGDEVELTGDEKTADLARLAARHLDRLAKTGDRDTGPGGFGYHSGPATGRSRDRRADLYDGEMPTVKC